MFGSIWVLLGVDVDVTRFLVIVLFLVLLGFVWLIFGSIRVLFSACLAFIGVLC